MPLGRAPIKPGNLVVEVHILGCHIIKPGPFFLGDLFPAGWENPQFLVVLASLTRESYPQWP